MSCSFPYSMTTNQLLHDPKIKNPSPLNNLKMIILKVYSSIELNPCIRRPVIVRDFSCEIRIDGFSCKLCKEAKYLLFA